MRRKVIGRELMDALHGGASWWAMKLECGHEMLFKHNGSTKRKFPATMDCSKESAVSSYKHCDIG